MQYYRPPTHLITYVQNECYYIRRSSYAPAIAIVVRLIIQLTVNFEMSIEYSNIRLLKKYSIRLHLEYSF